MIHKLIALSSVLGFLILGVLILLDQYLNIGVWFQVKDIHHETFALMAFSVAIGIIIGALIPKRS